MDLNITSIQWDQIAKERFLDRVTTLLVADFPDSRASLYAADTRETLRQLYDRAHIHGFTTEIELARYLAAAWLLGADFDTRYPAIADIIALKTINAAQKAEAIEQVTMTMIDTLENGAPA